jgi:hypothetical protein
VAEETVEVPISFPDFRLTNPTTQIHTSDGAPGGSLPGVPSHRFCLAMSCHRLAWPFIGRVSLVI